jgi:hypothetical protein
MFRIVLLLLSRRQGQNGRTGFQKFRGMKRMTKATACTDFETRSRPRYDSVAAATFTFYLGNPFPLFLLS